MTDKPGGGLLEKVQKALVGTLLCRVEVKGEACMCNSKLGAGTVQGAGNRACMGVFPAKLPCMEVL